MGVEGAEVAIVAKMVIIEMEAEEEVSRLMVEVDRLMVEVSRLMVEVGGAAAEVGEEEGELRRE